MNDVVYDSPNMNANVKLVLYIPNHSQDVDKLRESIKSLTATQAALANDLKHKLDNEESNILAMDADIASTRDELALVEKQSAEHKENEDAKRSKVLAEIESAKKMADIIKNAYERAQKDANDFTALPDEELATEMKHLDEMEKDTIEDANRERDELIKSKLSHNNMIVDCYYSHTTNPSTNPKMTHLNLLFSDTLLHSGAHFGETEA